MHTMLVKILTGKTICVDYEFSDSVQELRERVASLSNTTTAQVLLISAGRQMEDGRTLSDYKLDNFASSIPISATIRLTHQQRNLSIPSISPAQLVSQQGLMKTNPSDMHYVLGHSVMKLLTSIQITISQNSNERLDPKAHFSYAATVVSALSKGDDSYQFLLKNPQSHSIPAFLINSIKNTVTTNPVITKLEKEPEFASKIKKQLIQGNWEELEAEFGSNQEYSKTSNSSCCVM